MRNNWGGLVLLWLWLAAPSAADIACDGTDDELASTVDAISNMLTIEAGTLMAWIKPEGSPSGTECWDGQTIAGPAEAEVLIGMQSNTNACGFAYDGASQFALAASTSGAWMHLTMTYTANGSLLIYKNGVQTNTDTVGTISATATVAKLCGNTYSGFFQGRVGPVRLYTTALSANEIASIGGSRLYHVGTTAPSAVWNLTQCGDGTSGDAVVFADASNNGRTITGTNGANDTGLTCHASEYVALGEGIQ